MCVFNERDKEEAKELLKQHFSDLSKRGSHDDMSVAAIIDKGGLPKAVEYYTIISEVRQLNAEKKQRQDNIALAKEAHDRHSANIEDLRQRRDGQALSNWNWWINVRNEKAQNDQKYSECEKAVSEAKSKAYLANERKNILSVEFTEWLESSKRRIEELRYAVEAIKNEVYSHGRESEPSSTTIQEKNIVGDSNVTKEVSIVSDNEVESNSINTDEPRKVYEKAINSSLTEEDIAEMDKESEDQAKNILNINK